jgi:DNA-binding beta-propeller fold protein YncE
VADSEAFGGSGGLIAVDPVTGRQTALSQGGLFRDPAGVAIARDGSIVVSDLASFDGTGGLIGVDPGTGRQTRIAASNVFQRPLGIAADASGQVVVAFTTRPPHDHGTVMRVNPANGEFHAISPEFLFVNPPGFVAVDAAGNVIVTEPDISGSESRVERIDPAGHVTVLTQDRPPGAIYGGVAVEPAGGILVGNVPTLPTLAQALLRIDPVSGVPTTIAQGDQIAGGPFGIALEANGNIVLISQVNGVIRVNPSTGAQSIVSKGGSFSRPLGIAVGR